MKIHIHDERSNEYLSRMYWGPLRAYARDRGIDMDYTDSTDHLKNEVVMVHGDKLSPERIQRLRSDGNTIIAWDINDSSYFSSSYVNSPEQHELALIFKVSGVPRQNEVNELNLDRNFKIHVSREKYLPDPQWEEFNRIRLAGKIKPLPYVLWHPLVPTTREIKPHAERSGKALVRGGNHFWRVILAFRLMQDGLLDENSEFATAAYFSHSMERRFQYCDSCKVERQTHGRSLYDAPVRRNECTNPVTGWELEGEFFGGPMFGKHEFGYWNNKCPHSFFFLAKEFERCRGPLDKTFLEKIFNGDMRPDLDFTRDLSRASYAADLKWLNTVNLPPRFWEAASVGTPSLYANRVEDQDYWPHVERDVHYYTYPETMDFDLRMIPAAHWTEVSKAVKDLYETKIRGTQYPISNALLEYMVESIETIL